MRSSGPVAHGGRPVKLELVDRPDLTTPPRQAGPPAGHVRGRRQDRRRPQEEHDEAPPDRRRWRRADRRRAIRVSARQRVGRRSAGFDRRGSRRRIAGDGVRRRAGIDRRRTNCQAQRLGRRSAGKNTPVYEFANRTYTISTPIKLFSGLKLRGTGGLPAREFDGGTVIVWQGDDDSSVFVFPPEGQSGQNYPTDGSPRDISISGLLFEGGASTNVFPRLSMSTGSHVGKTLWYSSLHNLGVRAMRTFWWGYGTGVSLTGSFHAQALSDTPLYLGGSENTIFGTQISRSWTTVRRRGDRAVRRSSDR